MTAEVLKQLNRDLTWDGGFVPVAGMLESPMTITVLAGSAWKTLKDLFQDISNRPGEIKFGFPGINVPSYFGTHAVLDGLRKTGLSAEVHEIFFEGGAATKAAHLGGQVDVVPAWTMDAVPETRAGLFRILAVASDERLTVLPEVPTIEEAGYSMPKGGAGMALRLGVWAPKRTPSDVISQLESLMAKVVETPEWREFADSLGAVGVFRSGEEVRELFQAETELFTEIAGQILR